MSDPVLYQVHPMCGLLSFSPYCVKVQLALRLKGIAFTTVDTLFPSVNPHNKVPFLVWGERKLEDSTAIIAALDESAGGPKLIPEDPKLRAEAHILEDWADESLYWQGVRVKFVLDDVWARIEPDFKKGFPIWLARRSRGARRSASSRSRGCRADRPSSPSRNSKGTSTRCRRSSTAAAGWSVTRSPSPMSPSPRCSANSPSACPRSTLRQSRSGPRWRR
jgi:hypothetical protein